MAIKKVSLSMGDRVDQTAIIKSGKGRKIDRDVYDQFVKKYGKGRSVTITKPDVAISKQEIQIHKGAKSYSLRPYGDYFVLRIGEMGNPRGGLEFLEIGKKKTLRNRSYLGESMFNFKVKGITAIKGNKVLRSKYATVGPEYKAVGGKVGYSVYDDVKKKKFEMKSPSQAFDLWHEINLREFKKKNYAYKTESVDGEIVEGQSGSSLDGKSKSAAKNYLHKLIGNRFNGFFSDQGWRPVKWFYSEMNRQGIDWKSTDNFYSKDKSGRPNRKTWKLEISFVDNRGKKQTLYGNIVAAGAGSVDDPLSRYDLTFNVS